MATMAAWRLLFVAFSLFVALLLLISVIGFTVQGDVDLQESDVELATNGSDGFDGRVLQPASAVKTVFHFPNNADKSTPAGEPAEILVGISNNGNSPLNVRSIWATLHLPVDHRYQVQNLSAVEFNDAIVPPSMQASFPYTFAVSKYLQAGSFSLVANVMYEIDGRAYVSVFYNGTIEVVEAGGFVSGETLFLVTLGLCMFGPLGMWIYGHFQKLSQKSRGTKKVETGTRMTETLNNEWLQGTAFTEKLSTSISQTRKSKKKK